ncbi:hypothetical protein Tco_0930409 [Tanacetum coccineum]
MMSKSANQIPTPDGSAFRNTANKGIKQTLDDPPGFRLDEAICEFCNKHYDQLLSLMAEKVYQEKLRGVQTRLSFEGPKSSHHGDSLGSVRFTRLGEKERNVFTRLGNKEHDVFSHLDANDHRLRNHAGTRSHASACPATRDTNQQRSKTKNLIQSYVTCSGERQAEIEREWNVADRANRGVHMSTRETALSGSENSGGGHWKAKSTK